MNKDKKTDSPSPPKKSFISLRRSKSDIKTLSKYQNQNQPESSSSRNDIINWVSRKFNGQTSPKNTSSPEKRNKDKNTVTDSVPTNSGSETEKEENDSTEEKIFTLTAPDADEYYMEHPRRGKAIIFNHEHFDKEDRREGTHADVEKLKITLEELKFEVHIHNDLEYSDVRETVKVLSMENFTNCDCIAFFILTHGNHKQEIAGKDVYYSFEKIWEPFCATKCPTLAGKPKLFFISACRGRKKDSGKKAFFGSSKGKTQTDSGTTRSVGYKIPNNADFLMAYSTVDGFYSYRDSKEGTWFIQSLCRMLKEHYTTKDLLKILTLTSRDVALCNSTQGEVPENTGLVQIPSITSMLIRDVYFRN